MNRLLLPSAPPASAPRTLAAHPNGPRSSPAVPAARPRLAWVGGPVDLRIRVADHAGAVGAELVDLSPGDAGADGTRTEDAAVREESWRVVIGSLPALARRRTRRPDLPETCVGVTGPAPVAESDWRLAVRLGLRALVRLPDESAQLLDLLGALARTPDSALVIGVLGGCGGAGASSLAARLAGAAARGGSRTVLVDADPLGGGLDVLVEAPEEKGVRWEDVGVLGEEDGRSLLDGLPVVDGVHLLTARSAGAPTPAQSEGVIRALSPLGGTLVVDLGGQHIEALTEHCGAVIIVCPATVHAVRACTRRLRMWGPAPDRAGLVVRRSGMLHPREVAEDLGLGLLGDFRDSPPGIVPLLDVRRRGADALCTRLITRLTRSGGPAAAVGGRS